MIGAPAHGADTPLTQYEQAYLCILELGRPPALIQLNYECASRCSIEALSTFEKIAGLPEMTHKQVIVRSAAREKLVNGAAQVADAVRVTSTA